MMASMYSSACIFFFKQKTAYDMRISDWSSDVCSSDLFDPRIGRHISDARAHHACAEHAYLLCFRFRHPGRTTRALLSRLLADKGRADNAACDRVGDRKSVV